MTAERWPWLEKLAGAVRRRFGAQVHIDNVSLPTLGGSNRTIIFDLIDGSSRRRLVSREETYVAENSPFLSPSDQFALMRRVLAHGFPVPEPLFEYDAGDGMLPGYVSTFVEGETMPKVILHAQSLAVVRSNLAAECGELLAMLHGIAAAEVPFLATRVDSVDAVAAQRDRYDSYGGRRPAIELGLRWLELNRHATANRVLLHGDFRVGNLMVRQAGIVAVLDWECAHLGAPAEDLGWLCTRAWRFDQPHLTVGGFDHLNPLLEAYAAASGLTLDGDTVRYWTIFGLVRWAILNLMQVNGHLRGDRRSVVFAACGRNINLVEYDLLMTLNGRYH